MKITIANVKGGVGKTTTAMFLAAGLADDGRTLLVDADPKASAMRWSEQAGELPFPVIAWPVRDLARRVTQVADDYEHIVIDTGPEQEHLVRQALMVTDRLLIPLAPSPIEVDRVGATLMLAAEAEDLGAVISVGVLLTRVRTRTLSATAVRRHLAGVELPLLDAEVRLLEHYAQAHGGGVADEPGDYVAVLAELLAGVSA